MDDARVWEFEESLWTADAERYAALIDAECVMVVPQEPFVLGGQEAIDAVSATPRWTSVNLTRGRISRPEEGLIVVAYHARAEREDQGYEAFCTSTYRRLGTDEWRVVQHQQTPPLRLPAT
jgi:hypothetical protein